jgi:hypothetical protein
VQALTTVTTRLVSTLYLSIHDGLGGLAENADDLTRVPQPDLMCLNTVVFKDMEKWHKMCRWADIVGSVVP